MPGLKRPSLSLEIDDDEEEVGSPSGPNKRPRLDGAVETSEGNAVSSSDDDDADDDDADMDDDDDDDESVGEVDDEQIAELARQRENLKRPSRAAENGIIESVTCTNFMCHAHLHVELGPLINFVIGHNGSGKSAVLTALTICLGGKASSTNRASTLKAFIKEGQDSCTLSVKIKNKDGYQPEVFGDTIQVERSFSKTGSSGFKIKNSTGRTISTTKAALDDILDFFALSFDNPISVLTQDMARQFLADSTPTDKYKFFIKGVQLEQLNHDYELLSENIDTIEAVHRSRAPTLEKLTKAKRDTQRRVDILNQQGSVHARIAQLQAQMAWSQVEEKERELQACEQAVREAQTRIEEAQSVVDSKSIVYQQAHEANETAVAAHASEIEKLAPLQAELAEAEMKLADANKEVEDAHTEQRQNKENQTKLKRRIAKTEGEIEIEKQRLEEASGGSAAARFERLENARNSLAELQQESKRHVDLLPDLQRKRDVAEHNVKDYSGPVTAKRNEVTDAERQLRSLRDDHNQARDGFPPKTSELMAAIHAATVFRQKPIGPIGKHIQLLDPKWSSVLERNLGNVLNGFIVTCKEDRDKLSGIMRRVGVSSNINIIRPASRFDVSNNEPDSQHNTMARVLNITNDLVFNQLIISQRIEQIMLIENENEATELMSRGRIANVKACLTLDQNQAGIGHSYTWNSQGLGLSSAFIERYNGYPRIKSSVEDQVRIQQDVVNQLKDEQRTLEQKHRELQLALKTCEQEIVRHGREAKNFKERISVLREDMDQIQREIDDSSIEEGHMAELQNALTSARQALQEEEEAHEAIVENKDEQLALQQQHRGVVADIKDRSKTVTRDIERANRRRIDADERRQSALRAKNGAIDAKEAADRQREHLVDARSQQDELVQAYHREAVKISPRVAVPPNQNSEALSALLDKLIASVQRQQQEAGGSLAQVSELHRQATAAHRSFRKVMSQELDLLASMKQSLLDRQTRWRRFRKYISARARTTFMTFLSERAFKGHLAIDHDKRKLQIFIQPNESDPSSAARQAKTLSGGEKSFSTICLILSLWEAICAPVRCLDEFDVFMDSANREMSSRLLIEAAHQAQERQFIFITPQSMSHVAASPDIKLIKMADPERGQTTLAFGR